MWQNVVFIISQFRVIFIKLRKNWVASRFLHNTLLIIKQKLGCWFSWTDRAVLSFQFTYCLQIYWPWDFTNLINFIVFWTLLHYAFRYMCIFFSDFCSNDNNSLAVWLLDWIHVWDGKGQHNVPQPLYKCFLFIFYLTEYEMLLPFCYFSYEYVEIYRVLSEIFSPLLTKSREL